MSPDQYIFRDATLDADALRRANHAPEFSQALSDLRFTLVGIMDAKTADPSFTKGMRLVMDEGDAEYMNRILEVGEAVEVWSSPDRMLFAIPERTVAGPVVSMQTVLENGVVIETLMRPERAPRPAQIFQDGSFRINVAWLRLFTGSRLPIWPRQNWASSGYYLELVETREVHALFDRHVERIRAIQSKTGSPIPPHLHLSLYRAIHVRFQKIVEFQSMVRMITPVVLIFLVMTLILKIPLPVLSDQGQMLVLLCGLPVAMLVLGLLAIILSTGLNRLLVRLIGAPIIPLEKLISQQEQVQ